MEKSHEKEMKKAVREATKAGKKEGQEIGVAVGKVPPVVCSLSSNPDRNRVSLSGEAMVDAGKSLQDGGNPMSPTSTPTSMRRASSKLMDEQSQKILNQVTRRT